MFDVYHEDLLLLLAIKLAVGQHTGVTVERGGRGGGRGEGEGGGGREGREGGRGEGGGKEEGGEGGIAA